MKGMARAASALGLLVAGAVMLGVPNATAGVRADYPPAPTPTVTITPTPTPTFTRPSPTPTLTSSSPTPTPPRTSSSPTPTPTRASSSPTPTVTSSSPTPTSASPRPTSAAPTSTASQPTDEPPIDEPIVAQTASPSPTAIQIITTNPDNKGQTEIVGPGFTFKLTSGDPNGNPLPVDTSGRIILTIGGEASVSGTGFTPDSQVQVVLIGRSGGRIVLGFVRVRPDGTFSNNLPVPPDLPPGEYTLVAEGAGADGQPRVLEVPVVVPVEPVFGAPAALACVAGPQPLCDSCDTCGWDSLVNAFTDLPTLKCCTVMWLIIAMLLIGQAIMFFFAMRRRDDSEDADSADGEDDEDALNALDERSRAARDERRDDIDAYRQRRDLARIVTGATLALTLLTIILILLCLISLRLGTVIIALLATVALIWLAVTLVRNGDDEPPTGLLPLGPTNAGSPSGAGPESAASSLPGSTSGAAGTAQRTIDTWLRWVPLSARLAARLAARRAVLTAGAVAVTVTSLSTSAARAVALAETAQTADSTCSERCGWDSLAALWTAPLFWTCAFVLWLVIVLLIVAQIVLTVAPLLPAGNRAERYDSEYLAYGEMRREPGRRERTPEDEARRRQQRELQRARCKPFLLGLVLQLFVALLIIWCAIDLLIGSLLVTLVTVITMVMLASRYLPRDWPKDPSKVTDPNQPTAPAFEVASLASLSAAAGAGQPSTGQPSTDQLSTGQLSTEQAVLESIVRDLHLQIPGSDPDSAR